MEVAMNTPSVSQTIQTAEYILEHKNAAEFAARMIIVLSIGMAFTAGAAYVVIKTQ